jgi:hypothetical protein
VRVGEGEDLTIQEHGKGSTYICLSDEMSDSYAETIIYDSGQMQKIIDLMIINRDRMVKKENER